MGIVIKDELNQVEVLISIIKNKNCIHIREARENEADGVKSPARFLTKCVPPSVLAVQARARGRPTTHANQAEGAQGRVHSGPRSL